MREALVFVPTCWELARISSRIQKLSACMRASTLKNELLSELVCNVLQHARTSFQVKSRRQDKFTVTRAEGEKEREKDG